MASSRLLESLTPAQAAAVQHVDGPLLMLAGPGSGKTRVVTHRIAHLRECGVPGENILALTFTNKAADEMRQRLELLSPQSRVWMGTFHRFCARLLRRHCGLVGLHENYTIIDAKDATKLLKNVVNDSPVELTHTSVDQIAQQISWAKSNLIMPQDFVPKPGNPVGMLVAEFYQNYQKRLLAANAVDFDDLLLHVGSLLRESGELRKQLDEQYRYIMVDEYQDTNLAQYSIVRALSIDYPNLAVTGDPDQGIYAWRGANIDNILGFERDYPHVDVIRLEENFRSTPEILAVADALIANNKNRKPKTLLPQLPPGCSVRLTSYRDAKNEAEDIAGQIAYRIHEGASPSEFAVLYRTNSLSRSIEHSLRALGIPYQVVKGQEFYQRREVRDVIGYLHLINNPLNNVAFARCVNLPPRGIGAKTQKLLQEYADDKGMSLLEASREAGLISSLSHRAAMAIARFVTLYDQLSSQVTSSLADVVSAVVDETGLRDYFAQLSSDDVDRVANLEELIAAASEFDEMNPETDNLDLFLEQASLVADTDAWEQGSERVTLMTLHASKGLEFPSVFIVALEDGILPIQRANETVDLEEERRLLFVGITRAQRELQISLARRRMRNGRTRDSIVSSFLMELPRDQMDMNTQADAHSFDERAVIADARQQLENWRCNANQWDGIDEVPDEVDFNAEAGEGQDDQHDFGPAVQTAADLAKSERPDRPSLNRAQMRRLRTGMIVRHPEHGIGVIVSLDAMGKKKRLQIQFDETGVTQTFMLPFVPLEIVSYGDAFEQDAAEHDDPHDDSDIPF